MTATEEAQMLADTERKIQARRDSGDLPVVVSTAKHIDETLARIQKKVQLDSEKQNVDDREEKVRELKARWQAPKRQVDCVVRPEGEWGARMATLRGKLGTGFIAGLVGNRGTGKTQIAVELMRETVEKRIRSALYVSAIEFFMHIKSSYKKDASETELDVIQRFRKPRLLVIDEIGRRGETEWENNLLFELIDKRYQDVKDTLLISNQDKSEFNKSIGPSLVSRMNETGGIIDCTWQSFRE